MRILGIDYGDARIGAAVSDPMGWTAQAVETIYLKEGETKAVKRICQLVGQYDADKVVVGFPRNMNGTVGPRGEKTIAFIQKLDKAVNCGEDTGEHNAEKNVEIIKWDERLTSVAANRTMHELGTKISKKKAIVDQIAAVYILQGYLDSIR